MGFLIPLHFFTNFEVQIYLQNELKFNGVDQGWKMSNNLDDYKPIGIHWIDSYVKDSNLIYFDSFRVESIPEVIK